MTFAQFLREKLDEKGWGEKDLVEKTGISLVSIHSYLIGARPRNDNFEIICKALGINPYDLSYLDDEKEYVRMAEARKRLGVSNAFIVKAILNGTLPGCTDGREATLPRIGFENYMQGLTKPMLENCIRTSEGIMYEMLNRILKNAPSVER